ncbi:MAG: hypothetical protein WC570_00430, partial [Patescibacteria group bacterium]
PPTPPAGQEITPYYVPIIGWTFPNSFSEASNDIETKNTYSDLDGKFELVLEFTRLEDFLTNISAYYDDLGIYPGNVEILINEETIKSGQPIYVLMPPTVKLAENNILETDSININGTAAPNVNINIYIYNDSQFRIYQVTTDNFGFWELNLQNDLPPGEYSIYAVADNIYGFISLPSSVYNLTINPRPIIGTGEALPGDKIRRYFDQDQLVPIVSRIEQLAYWSAIGLIAFSLFGLIFEIFSLILLGLNQIATWLGIIPARDPWGVVYNSDTKKPVDLAIVRLYNTETKKQVESKVTDKNGRYGFLVKKGKYIIKVAKHDFRFPALGSYGLYDGRYTNIYLGEEITVHQDNEIINLNIPITPKETIKQALTKKGTYNLRRLQYYLGVVSFPLLSLGFVISIAIALLHGGFVNYFIMLVYFGALVYKIYKMSIQPKPWGLIYDSKTGLPISMAIVKIIDPEYDRIMETKLTDPDGRFAFLVVPGKYIVQVEKTGYQFPTNACVLINKKKKFDWYCGQVFEIKSEKEAYINIDIPLDRAANA